MKRKMIVGLLLVFALVVSVFAGTWLLVGWRLGHWQAEQPQPQGQECTWVSTGAEG